MNIDLVDSYTPLWKITDWKVPHIDYTQTHAYDQSSKHYKSSDLRQTINSGIDLYGQDHVMQEMLRNDNSILFAPIKSNYTSNIIDSCKYFHQQI